MERALDLDRLTEALGEHPDLLVPGLLPSPAELQALMAEMEVRLFVRQPRTPEEVVRAAWYLHGVASSDQAFGVYTPERQRRAFQLSAHIFDLALGDRSRGRPARLQLGFAAEIGYRRGELDPNATAVYRRVQTHLQATPPLLDHAGTLAVEAGVALLDPDSAGVSFSSPWRGPRRLHAHPPPAPGSPARSAMSRPGAPRLVPALFDGRRLTQARLYHGWRKVEVAKAIGVTPAAIGQYELGRTYPGSAVLAALAVHLGFPPPFFEAGRHLVRVAEGQVQFRRLRSTSKGDRDRLRTRLELLAEILARVEARVQLPPIAIPDVAVDGEGLERAERAAAEVRRAWELGSGPIDNMVRLLEAKGIIVVRPTTDTRDVDAFSAWADTRPIVVLGSDKHDTARSRFDAAHELGHLVLHHDVEPGRQAIEQEAHRFAAAFLMPADAVARELPRRMRWPVYFELKQRWRVALAALLYRARTLGALSPDAYRRAQAQLSQRGWREHEPIDLGAPEVPNLLHRALRLLADELGVQAADVAAEVRLPPKVFSSLIADVVAAPRPALSI